MNFFGRKNRQERPEVTFEQQLAEQQVAPGTQLHYDSQLIGRLRGHHDALLELAGKAMATAQAARFEDTKKCVRQLRLLLNEHLLERNLRLYTYLSCCLHADPEGLELTRSLRRDMGEISRKSTRFVAHFEGAGIGEENNSAFVGELAQVTSLLADHFAREEQSLYPLYQPPQSYAVRAASRPSPARRRPLAAVALAAAC